MQSKICLADLLREDLEEQKRFLSSLTPKQAKQLPFQWRAFWARPNQLPPEGDDWFIWFLRAGRGYGKTRTGAEYVREMVENGLAKRIALIGPTAGDARDVMVEGESGLINVCPEWNKPVYEPSKRRVTWPSGALATLYSADEPERLRGPQHDLAWADELGAWRYAEDAWDMAMLGLRLGKHPRCVVTTTPKSTTLIRKILKSPTTRVTVGSTYENRANLAEPFFAQIISKYEGTRLGKQEIYAELLEENAGALWNRAMLEASFLPKGEELPLMKRIVVAIDPAVSASARSDETGIIVAGLGDNGRGYLLEDASGRMSPDAWAAKAVKLYRKWQADRIVAEINNGGQMVEITLRTKDPNVSYRSVHASKGKSARAEPISAMYEQGKIKHAFRSEELEDQLCTWEPLGDHPSPDRLDALVWAFTDLMLNGYMSIIAAPVVMGQARDVPGATPFPHMPSSFENAGETLRGV